MWSGLLYAMVMNAEVFIVVLKEDVTLHSILLLLVPWIMLVSGYFKVSVGFAPNEFKHIFLYK